MLLLLASANVAGLHLARASERTRELAIQVSLGASRLRVVRPLILESLFVALLGGGLAIGVAAWLPSFVMAHAPVAVSRAGEVGVDARVVLFTGVLTLGTALFASLAPALNAARRSLRMSLAGGRTSSPGGGALRTRESLVVTQVAGALALMVAAGLLVRSVSALSDVDPGFDADHVLSVSLRLEPARYPGAAEVFAFHDELLRSLRALPGVEDVAAVSMLPFGGDRLCDDVAREGEQPTGACTEYRSATPGYFAALGIPLTSGRDFARTDDGDAPKVAVLSESVARALFPDGRAVGGRIQGRGETWQIVGVVPDVRLLDLADPPPPAVYLPFRQAPFRMVTAVIRTRDPDALASAVSSAVWSVDPLLAVRSVTSLTSLVLGSVATQRFRSAVVTAFGAVGVCIALLGIAGLLFQLVHQRRREIGIRMALGSSSAGVVGSVLRRAAVLVLVGGALGWGLSLLTGRALARFLFGVSPADPVSVLVALGLVTAAALVAAIGPALRAASVEPMHVLKDD